MRHILARIAPTTLLLSASLASGGQPVILDINPGTSSIDLDATLISPVGDQTDTAVSPVSGTIEIELDSFGNPVEITIHDFEIIIDDDIDLSYDYGFLGSANATITGGRALYAAPAPTGPLFMSPPGTFDFPAALTSLDGVANGSYSFFLVGSDTITTDLSTIEPVDVPISGEIVSDGAILTLTSTFDVMATQTLVEDVADLELVGTLTIVATGDVPSIACNAADVEAPFGVLDLGDISTFVDSFLLQTPVSDLAEPMGTWDLSDLQAFITAFSAGCP